MKESMKDPAFLFYSKDFYEGTRTMLPEERACYIDLLIYQHQNGVIPSDLKRVKMYCSGVDEATLEATLKAKFKHTSQGWLNERLDREIKNRQNFSKNQSESGKIGQFWKKIYSLYSKKEVLQLKKQIDNDMILSFLEENKTINKDTLEGLLKRRLNNKANVNANANEDVNINIDKDVLFKREENFKKTIEPFLKKYGKEMCNAFYLYWTEPDKAKRKLRFEMEKTWDVSRRLASWSNNQIKFNKNNNSNSKSFKHPYVDKPVEKYEEF